MGRGSNYDEQYRLLVGLLRFERKKKKLTQADVAAGMQPRRVQTFVSDVENGQRRLDLVELRELCRVLNVGFVPLVRRWEREIASFEGLDDESSTSTVRSSDS